VISALHKSVRSSDVDAALYWLTRMLEAGEDACTSRAASSAWPSKTSAWPTRALLEQAVAAMQASTSSAFPKATSPWRRRPSIYAWPRNPTPAYRAMKRRA